MAPEVVGHQSYIVLAEGMARGLGDDEVPRVAPPLCIQQLHLIVFPEQFKRVWVVAASDAFLGPCPFDAPF